MRLSGPVDGGSPGLMVHGPDSGQHETRPLHDDPEQHSAQPTADPGTPQSTTPVLVGFVPSARTFWLIDRTATASRKTRNTTDAFDMTETSMADSTPKMGVVIDVD